MITSDVDFDLLPACYKTGGRVFGCGVLVFTAIAPGVIVDDGKTDDETLLKVGRKTEAIYG